MLNVKTRPRYLPLRKQEEQSLLTSRAASRLSFYEKVEKVTELLS